MESLLNNIKLQMNEYWRDRGSRNKTTYKIALLPSTLGNKNRIFVYELLH